VKRSLDIGSMNVRVGLMALGGFAILVWALFFPVRGVSFFTSKIEVTGYYERVDGLRRNAPVFYRGIEVGQVKSVEIEEGRSSAPMRVVVSVEHRVLHLLPKTTVMHIIAQGLLGDVFVDLEAPTRKPDEPLLADGDICATLPYDSVLAGMNGLTGRVQTMLDQVNSLLAKAQSRESSVGRLFTEDDLYRELVAAVRELKTTASKINEIQSTINTKLMDPKTKESVDKAVVTAQRVLDRADNLTAKAEAIRWHLGLGFSKYEGTLYGATAGIRIIPSNDRFYEGGLSYFNESLTFTAKDTLAGGYAGYDAFLGWRVLGSPAFFRGGLKRTNVAAGLDFRLNELLAWAPVELHFDAYRFGQTVSQFDLGASISFLQAFKLTGGVEDMANTPRYKVGLDLIYDDEDLTSILVKSKM
jgi:hypothetical protein